jgi:capsular polysaccharide biosynthesis protein
VSLSRKFIIIILLSIFIVAIVNIVAFYIFYNTFFKIYLTEKSETKKEITLNYINKLIEKQTEDEIDNIFSDAEINFFELLENND